jgi:hypothetical protein
MLKIFAVLATTLAATAASAQQTTIQQPMTFGACLQSVDQASVGLTQPPTTTIDTPDKREVVLSVPDGKVTVTCDAVNQQATMTHQK